MLLDANATFSTSVSSTEHFDNLTLYCNILFIAVLCLFILVLVKKILKMCRACVTLSIIVCDNH